MDFDNQILSVSDVNRYLKARIESDTFLSSVQIRGEISNFIYHKSGHMYFSLKDEGGIIKAVIFKGATYSLKFMPENGMKVVAHGRLGVYEAGGYYNLYIDRLEPDGIGALYLKYEQLKDKLEKEGLFDTSKKQSIPKIPKRVGVITSPTGAAIRDIFNVTKRRFPYAEIVLYPALVQGTESAASLTMGMNVFNALDNVDVIIIGRGGGSIEDLWSFNDETLARAIYASHIPVISAVGHETDYTICDFVSDVRAPTPSAAAEIAVPDIYELQNYFNSTISYMGNLVRNSYNSKLQKFKDLSSRRVLSNPTYIYDGLKMRLAGLSDSLENNIKYKVKQKNEKFVELTSKLQALNPMSVISRGYSFVFNDEGKLVKSIKDINIGDTVSFKVSDGTVESKITAKREEKNNG